MSRLEDLRQIADETLGGLDADAGLKTRILSQAAEGRRPQRRSVPIAAISMACVAVAAVSVALLNSTPAPVHQPSVAATEAAEPALMAEEYAEEADMVMASGFDGSNAARSYQAKTQSGLITTVAAGDAVDHLCETALLSVESRTVSVSADAPDYHTLWEKGSGSSFPMLRVDDRYYRLLSEPASVSSSKLGSSVGTVELFTSEPSLASSNGVMSNIVTEGSKVYPVKGMDRTLVAAEVNGALRVFQRVSYSGHALKGAEKLADSLNISGHITEMSLSGVGTVRGASDCSRLFGILTSQASFESTGSLSNKQCLLITLDNGITVQMIVKGDRLAACGVWSCPEFLEAFEAACK